MPSMANCLTPIGIACALISPPSARLLNQKSLSAAIAIAQTALETCTKQGYNVSVHVIGAPGGGEDEVCSKAGIDKVADQLK
jgi:hypothetical protein